MARHFPSNGETLSSGPLPPRVRFRPESVGGPPSLTRFLHQRLEGVSYRGVITHDKRRTNHKEFVN